MENIESFWNILMDINNILKFFRANILMTGLLMTLNEF